MSGINPLEPEPVPEKIQKQNIIVSSRIVFSVFLSIFIVYGGFILASKAPFLYLKPGPAELVYISGKDIVEPLIGEYRFTTIMAEQMTYWELLVNSITNDKVIYEESQALPPSSTTLSEMDQSKLMAIGMATGITAGKRILAGAGALVITTKPNSPAETSGITTGDVIISINGKGVKNVIDLKALMLSENNPLRIEVVRRAVKREVTLSSPDKKLGVEVQTYLTASITPNLSIKTKDVGGPSAGLLFTLAAIDAIGKGSLNNGQIITGTGTIEGDGKIGEIEGIDFKIVNAVKAGGTVFLYPADNQAPIIPKGTKIKLVPVEDIYQAINWLCDNGGSDEICVSALVNSSDD